MRWIPCLALVFVAVLIAPPAGAQPNCGDPPDVLIVLDHSGSMTSMSGAQSKWAHAQAAVTNLAASFTNQIRFGLMLFPEHPSGGSCSGGVVNVSVGNNTSGAINATLSTAYPTGLTPIAASLQNAHSYLLGVDPAKKKYVVLITDGEETCSGNPIDWVNALSGAQIKTYVVGFGDSVDQNELNSLAQAGGTAIAGPTSYYQADSPAQLNQALQAIGSLVSCCGNAVLDPGEQCDKAIPVGKPGACPPGPGACNDNDACTNDFPSGTECSVVCSHTPVLQPKHNDGCCPPSASAATDNDCGTACGNGVLEPAEKCDSGIKNGPGKCKTLADCNDGSACTADSLSGSACNVQCKHTAIAPNPTKKDGCCPKGSSLTEDADCLPKCNPDSMDNCIDLCKGVNCQDGHYCVSGQCKPWPSDPGGGGGDPGDPAGPGSEWVENGGCALAARPSSSWPLLGLLLLGLALWRRR